MPRHRKSGFDEWLGCDHTGPPTEWKLVLLNDTGPKRHSLHSYRYLSGTFGKILTATFLNARGVFEAFTA